MALASAWLIFAVILWIIAWNISLNIFRDSMGLLGKRLEANFAARMKSKAIMMEI